ncbi:MAG: FAD-binding oxidoreductase [Betaproteobacteria bacterium]|nr:FAD-binding oxidoreductase [Betaproteobacteria bacterium]
MTQLIEQLNSIVGKAAVITDPQEVTPYATDWRKRYFSMPLAVVKPASTAEVAAVVKLCAATRTAIVPQGGNTGLCGGATPLAAEDAGRFVSSGAQIVLKLSRLNRVRAVDPVSNTITVEAGCVLAKLQQAAAAAGRLFPLSLAAEGSCEIGGNLSTNAGGTAVLRYGNARDLVLGLEVVLPDGQIWDGLRGLRKDNTGYDLKQLFVGAEGTLGIITAAVLKLFPRARAKATALVALESPARALELLSHLQGACGDRLTGFELMSAFCLSLVAKHYPATRLPFTQVHPQYVLLELSDTASAENLDATLQEALAKAAERSLVLDAAVAANEAQAAALWALRENIPEAQVHEGQQIKHDISVPISRIAEYIAVTDAELERAFPGVRMVTFGHLGDGNLHYNIAPPAGADEGAFMARASEVSRVVHDSVARFSGSISAEHGLGQYKRDEILRYKSPLEMELMRRIKAALDPRGIMNPGKVL